MAKAPGGGDDGEDGGNGKDLMSASELKPLLVQSKRKPVSCAIGMTKDKQGVLLLDRRMKPRKLMAAMKAKAKSAGLELDQVSVRFGRVSVDPGDSATAVFTVNKEAPAALRMKLQAKLRPAGFRKCDITVDAKLEDEGEEDEPEGDGADAGASPGGQAAAGATTGGSAGPSSAGPGSTGPGGADTGGDADGSPRTAGPGAQAGPGGDDQATAGQDTSPRPAADPAGGGTDQTAGAARGAGTPDKATVARRLGELVKRLAVVLPAKPPNAGAMRQAATEGQAAVKSGDLAAAGQAADTLERLLGGTGGSTGAADAPRDAPADGNAPPQDPDSTGNQAGVVADTAPPGRPDASGTSAAAAPGQDGKPAAADRSGASALFPKGCQAWKATRAKVQADIESVMKAASGHHGQEGDEADVIRTCFAPILRNLDDRLAAKLDEAAKGQDAGARSKVLQDAQAIIKEYTSFVDSSPLVKHLDENPYKPLTVRKTLDAALAALSKIVQLKGRPDTSGKSA